MLCTYTQHIANTGVHVLFVGRKHHSLSWEAHSGLRCRCSCRSHGECASERWHRRGANPPL